jgi:hypothetical protein
MADTSPDIGAAVMLYIRDCAPLTVAYNPIVILNWPTGSGQEIKVPPFRNVVFIGTGVGGPGDVGLGMNASRLDIKSYGVDRRIAYEIARMVDQYLLPYSERRKTSFVKAQCSVKRIDREGDFLRLIDDTAGKWPFTVRSYIFTYSLEPVS